MTLRKSPLGRRRAPERSAATLLDSRTLSTLLGRTVGFGLVLAASAAAAQTGPAQPAPAPAAPPTGGSPTETRATAQAPPDVALPGVDVEAPRERDYLVPGAALGVAPSVTSGLGGPTALTASFFYQHENNVADDGVSYVFGLPAPVNPNNYGLAKRDLESAEVYIGTLRLDHAFSDSVKLRSTLRYAWYGRESRPTAPAIAGTVTPATDVGTVQVTRGSRARSSEEAILSSATDVTASFSTWGLKNKLVAGVEVDRETFDPVDTTGTAFGAYAIDELSLTEWLKLIGGMRWDYFSASQTTWRRSAAGSRFANASNTNQVPGYVRGDLTLARHPLPQVELRMNALNVGDNRFFEGVSGGHVVPGAARTCLFTGTFTY